MREIVNVRPATTFGIDTPIVNRVHYSTRKGDILWPGRLWPRLMRGQRLYNIYCSTSWYKHGDNVHKKSKLSVDCGEFLLVWFLHAPLFYCVQMVFESCNGILSDHGNVIKIKTKTAIVIETTILRGSITKWSGLMMWTDPLGVRAVTNESVFDSFLSLFPFFPFPFSGSTLKLCRKYRKIWK